MKWTVLLLAIQLALAVTSPLFTDPHRAAPERVRWSLQGLCRSTGRTEMFLWLRGDHSLSLAFLSLGKEASWPLTLAKWILPHHRPSWTPLGTCPKANVGERERFYSGHTNRPSENPGN